MFGYSNSYDENLKKLLAPEIKVAKINPNSPDLKLREQFYYDELKYHLRWDRNVCLFNLIISVIIVIK